MAEITDPVVIATMVQTVVISLTLVIFILQFRSQERAMRESSYQNLLGRYNDFVMSGSSTDDAMLSRLLSQREEIKDVNFSEIRRIMTSYGIIEEAFELYKKGWIDEPTWNQWRAWLVAISKHPHFRTLHSMTQGMYDGDFQKLVSKMLESDSPRRKEEDFTGPFKSPSG